MTPIDQPEVILIGSGIMSANLGAMIRLDGRSHLLFGPFASWTTKFLHKSGRRSDLPLSIRTHNLATLLRTGLRNRHLVQFLLTQGMQSMADRLTVLHDEDLKQAGHAMRFQNITAGANEMLQLRPPGESAA